MPLINCEINLILTSSEDCLISSATGDTKFNMIDTKPLPSYSNFINYK